MFNDITNGTNPGCGTEGFNATPGWDPVTGFGTPNFQELKSAVTARFLSSGSEQRDDISMIP